MALIGVETFGDGDDKYLSLRNEEWGRRLQMGSDWTRLRIGIMAAVEPDGTNDLAATQLRLGISTGANDHVGSLGAKLWYGMVLNGNTTVVNLNGGPWLYDAGGGNPHLKGGVLRIRSLDGVVTGGGTISFRSLPVTTINPRRWPVVCEFEKSGTSMIVRAYGLVSPSDANAARDFTRAQFLSMLEDPGSSMSIDGVSLAFSTTTFTDHDVNAAAHGEVVAPHVGWNRTAQEARIYIMAMAKYA